MCNCKKKKEEAPPPIPKELEDKFIKELNEFYEEQDNKQKDDENPHPPYPLIED